MSRPLSPFSGSPRKKHPALARIAIAPWFTGGAPPLDAIVG